MYWSLVDLPSSSSFLELEKVLGSVGPISAASEMGNCLEHLMKVKGRSRTASILGGPVRGRKSGGLQRTTRLWDHNPDIVGHFSLAQAFRNRISGSGATRPCEAREPVVLGETIACREP